MQYSEDFIKKTVLMGTLNYPLKKMINVLDVADEDIESFTADFNNETSTIGRAYQKGVDKGEFSIDVKLFEMAKAGDIQALEKFEKRKRRNS